MPLVRVDAVAADPQRMATIGDAVHAALVDAFAIPADDRFQVLRGSTTDRVVYDPGFLGVDRDDGAVFVQVFLRRGRTDEQKRAFRSTTGTLSAADYQFWTDLVRMSAMSSSVGGFGQVASSRCCFIVPGTRSGTSASV